MILLCLQDKVAKAQEVKDVAMSSLAQAIEDEKKEQWRAEGRSMLFDAKRVSIGFVSQFVIFCFVFKQRSILTVAFLRFICLCSQQIQIAVIKTTQKRKKPAMVTINEMQCH